MQICRVINVGDEFHFDVLIVEGPRAQELEDEGQRVIRTS